MATQAEMTLDGRPATFQVEDEQLVYAWTDGTGGTKPWIDLKNIVAITPGQHGQEVILYTKSNLFNEDAAKGSPFVLQSSTVSGLPQALVEHYRPAANCRWLIAKDSPNDGVQRHVIVSTRSGTGTASAVFERLVRPTLMQLGLMEDEHYRSHHTVSETSVADLVENIVFPQANKGVEQAILLLSGDGGIVDTVNSLLSKPRSSSYRNPTVSLLPLGTGNALANSSGLTGDNTLGLRAMLQGGAKELPLFRVTFSSEAKLLVDEGRREQLLRAMIDGKPVAHGAVVCSWGHHASLVADSDTTEYRKFGAERFKMAAKEALFPSDGSPPHAYRGTVSIRRPGKDWKNIPRQEHGYVLATFVSQLEAGFTISPASKPLDGKLRLVHFGDLGGQEAMDVMTKAFQGGKHVDDNRVGYEEIEGVLIEFEDEDPRWRRVCIDGIIVVGEGGWVEVSTGIEGVVDLVCRQT